MPRSLPRLALAIAILGLHAFAAAAPAHGQAAAQQAAEQRLGRPVSEGEILSRLQASGMSRADAQQRLRQAGYDPALLDPYFDRIEAGGGQQSGGAGAPSGDFLAALSAIGLANPAPVEQAAATPESDPSEEETPDAEGGNATLASVGVETPPIFGKSIFAGGTNLFAPTTAGPVDPSYQLGPGDQIHLVLTGDVELAYSLDISREGAIVIPDVGQLFVNGLTLEGLRDRLYHRLGQVYSGVKRGPDATTHFDVSLGRLRTNQVYLIGEIDRPGAYQISALATVFHALYQGGGPSDRGSFRAVQVRRGDEVVHQIDVYDYLLHGSSRGDVRLQQGDIVYVPLAGPRVTLTGNVRRPGIFELRPGETLRDVLGFAGGFQADAFVQRMQIDRILPPAERAPGRERVLLDVSLERLLADSARIPLEDGDIIRVFGISNERRNRVTIRGEVFRPGVYEYAVGMTVDDLIERAEGLLADAYAPVAHVVRVNPEDGTLSMHRVSLARDSAGNLVQDVALMDLDQVVVYGRAAMQPPRTITIAGPVRKPGEYPFADGMTLRDAILAAGGTRPEFLPDRAHVARLQPDLSRTLLRFELEPDSIGIPRDEVALSPFDEVRIFSKQDLLLPQNVAIHGAVRKPGEYQLSDGMTVLDLILAAGGFEKGAQRLQLEVARRTDPGVRTDSLARVHVVALTPAALEYRGAADAPGDAPVNDPRADASPRWTPSPNEFVLRDGDQVFIRHLPGFLEVGTVQVAGEVEYPGPYAIQSRGETVSSFVRRAGGVTAEAFIQGARLVRDGTLVALDLRKALRDPGSREDLPLFPGDQLVVPQYDPTVLVTGAVPFEARVAYRPGADLEYYIEQAGGYADRSDDERVVVTYASGRRATRGSFLFVETTPDVQPGSSIFVPEKPADVKEGIDWDRLISRTTAILGTAATVIIAVERFQN